MMSEYREFIRNKSQLGGNYGFKPLWIPDWLYDFQMELDDWAIRKGRAAILADCGTGKTPMQLVWAENIIRKYNEPVLIVAPLAVTYQTKREAGKFGIECERSSDGKFKSKGIVITNYEKLHLFDPSDFKGVVCDESSAIKNFQGKRQAVVTEFLRTRPFRLLCSATAAPNDYIELGTSSEAVGALGRMDMLGRFFKNDENSLHPIWYGARWRFKKHAEIHFWRWVCSWARAMRKPSDLGFDDKDFDLPELVEQETILDYSRSHDGFFASQAITLHDQRAERRATIKQRCSRVAELVDHDRPAVVWCHLNDEADLLERIIPDAVQVSGKDSDDSKEEKFLRFVSGHIRVMVIKPRIGAFGLNWQHCSHVVVFPSHSWEQYYQAVRRCWRFGQDRQVTVDIVTTTGETGVLKNLQRKAKAADKMFDNLIMEMKKGLDVREDKTFSNKLEVPSWV